jgi:hypothetical protein
MRRGALNRGWLLVAMVVGGCVLTVPGAASATRLEIQFQAPAAGAIELIAVPYRLHFNGPTPPLHPAGLRVSLPRSGRPHSYGLLAGELRTRVHGHTATYVLLIETLRALTSASAAQPLLSENRLLTPISTGVNSTLHPTAGRLVIDSDRPTETQWKAFSDLLAKDGVSDPTAATFQVTSSDDGHAFHWSGDVAKQWQAWNAAWSAAEAPLSTLGPHIGEIEQTLGKRFGYLTSHSVTEEPTLDCPATTALGNPILLTGTGSPGAPLTILYTTPGASLPITVPLTIGSSGSYSESIPATAPGAYTFHAGGGTLGLSKTCMTDVVPAG